MYFGTLCRDWSSSYNPTNIFFSTCYSVYSDMSCELHCGRWRHKYQTCIMYNGNYLPNIYPLSKYGIVHQFYEQGHSIAKHFAGDSHCAMTETTLSCSFKTLMVHDALKVSTCLISAEWKTIPDIARFLKFERQKVLTICIHFQSDYNINVNHASFTEVDGATYIL